MKNKYLVYLIYDFFDRLAKATYFSNLCSGYWQIQIEEGYKAKMMCVTCYGPYKFLVMSFVLTNAPAMFCHLMNQVFYDYNDDFVVVYSHDVLVFSDSLMNHIHHLKFILSRLR